MRGRTVLVLFIIASALAAYIGLVERKSLSTRERQARRSRAFVLDPDRVSALSISNQGVRVQCRKEDDRWRVVYPVRARADEAEIQRVLYDLEAAEYSARITKKEMQEKGLDLADYGLDSPRAVVSYTEGDRTVTILVGKDAQLGDNVYVRVAGREEVMAVDRVVLEGLPREVETLRDHDLFYFKRHEVTELGLDRPVGYVRLKKTGMDHWRLTQPVEARADRLRVGRILDDLYAVRINDFVADDVQDATLYGLQGSGYRLEVFLSGRPEPETLLLGKAVDKDPSRLYVMWESERSVYTVSTTIVATLSTPLDELRDWRLVPIRDYEVGEVSLESGGSNIVLRKEETEWRLAEPVSVDADTGAVAQLLSVWTTARVSAFVSSASTNPAQYGLDRPVARVSFRPTSSAFSWTSEVTLAWGGPVPGRKGLRYVSCRGEKELWLVSDELLRCTSFDWLHYRTRQMLDLPCFTVRRLILQMGGETQVVARSDSSAPFRSETEGREALPESELQDLVECVGQLRAEELVASSPREPGRYGLDRPRIKLTVEVTPESGVGKTLLVGDPTPDGGAYAMVAGNDIVFKLSRELCGKLSRGLTRPTRTEGQKEKSVVP